MTRIDTNVLVRYLVEDDEEQSKRVHRFLAAARASTERIFISSLVLCETAWVLQAVYRVRKPSLLAHLESVLNADVFAVEDEDLVRQAIQVARKGKSGFADCLIGQFEHCPRLPGYGYV